ncbi:MAG: D-aminoacylase [Acidobacteria bacterium]|nr:D-aminoacylase [Acidobacteriota bacterium]
MKRIALPISLIAGLVALGQTQYDLLIRGGRLIDGTGNPWVRSDLAIQGDRIAAIGDLSQATAARVIDATGLIVAPGFIDPHTHSRRAIFQVPTADTVVFDGVTTSIEGNDGSSPWPVGQHLREIASTRITTNWGIFLGQGTVREQVMGRVHRDPTPEEMEKMKGLVAQGMEEGALGLSTGLIYVPGTFTRTEEIIELAKVAARYGGIYITHMRDEADGLLDSVKETIRIGEEGGLPVQITHHKAVGTKNWGRSKESLALIEAARARGADVTIDQYPYTASQTGIAVLLPPWAQEGTSEEVAKRLNDPATRPKIKEGIVQNILHNRGGGDPKNVFIGSCSWDPSLNGKSLAEISQMRGLSPTAAHAAEVTMEIVLKGGAQAIFHAMAEEDVERILQHHLTAVGSDGGVVKFGDGVPHPRHYGTFSRVLGRYVRERQLLPLEEAIRKMTSATAQRLSIRHRGLLREGFFADVVVFDASSVRDRAEFGNPHQYSEGFQYVLVNGLLVIDQGHHTGARSGRVIHGPGFREDAPAGLGRIEPR